MFSGVSLLHRRKKSDSKAKKHAADAAAAPMPVPAPAPNVAAPAPKPTVDVAVTSVVGLSRSATLGKQDLSPGVAAQPGSDTPRIRPCVDDVDATTPGGMWTRALANGDLAAMAGLLKSGGIAIDQLVDDADSEGHTGLMFAAQEGRDDIIRLLLNNRADMKKRDKKGRNPLMWASTWGRESTVTLLLDRGAAVDDTDDSGWTALMYASHYGFDAIVERFLDTGARYLTSDRKLPSPLQLAARNGFLDTVQKLIERYPQPEHLNWADFRGWSAVTEAAANGRLNVLRLLIDRGANADATDENRRNILHVAGLRGHMDVVRFILNIRPGMIDAVDALGATPLLLALDQRRVEVAGCLVSKGADLSKQDREGYTPAHVATIAGLTEVLRVLRGADRSVLDAADYRGNTPLLLAAGQGSSEIVKYLVAEQVDHTCVDRLGRNAVMIAAAAGHSGIVRDLLARFPEMLPLTDENCHPALDLATNDAVKSVLGPMVFPLESYLTERLDKVARRAASLASYDASFDPCEAEFAAVRGTLARGRPEKVLSFVTRALAAAVTRPSTDFAAVDPPMKKIDALVRRIAELEGSDRVDEQVDSIRDRGRLLIMLNERIQRKKEVADSFEARIDLESRRPVQASVADLRRQLAQLDEEKATLATERAGYAAQLEALVAAIAPLKGRFRFPKDGAPELESLARFEQQIVQFSEHFHEKFRLDTQKLTEDVEMLNVLTKIVDVQVAQMRNMFDREMEKDRRELDEARGIYDAKCNEVAGRVGELHGAISKQFDDMSKQFEMVNASNPMVEIRKSFLAALNKLEAEKAFHERLLQRLAAVRDDVDGILPPKPAAGFSEGGAASGSGERPVAREADADADDKKAKYKSLFFFEQDTMAAAEGYDAQASASSLISAVLKAASCASIVVPDNLHPSVRPVGPSAKPFSRGVSQVQMPGVAPMNDPRSMTIIRGEIPEVFGSSPSVAAGDAEEPAAKWESDASIAKTTEQVERMTVQA